MVSHVRLIMQRDYYSASHVSMNPASTVGSSSIAGILLSMVNQLFVLNLLMPANWRT